MSIAAAPVPERDPAVAERLTSLWETPKNIVAWLATVDHKKLGKRYIVTGFVFLFLGGVEALLLRVQLSRPENQFLPPEAFNQLFTMHGTTMMFLFLQPVLSGFSFFCTPLLIGSRELAFPRLNAFSYYVFLLAGIFMYLSFFWAAAPDAGWFAYTPLSGPRFDAGVNIDFYALGLLFLGIATTAGAINVIVTVLKMRAPGMSISRMPLFLWSSMTMSFAVVFSMPALNAALVLLELERRWHFPFYDPRLGGSPLLWQHLFWVFGHPWVYILFLPATGMLSMIFPVFSRRPIVGHTWVALATVATGFVGFGVWVHHMFATGLPQLSMSFFSAASMIVSIPSAIQIFAWIATMWYGRVWFTTSMLFAIGFIVQFVIGGMSGVFSAAVPADWQVTDTYFVVAHIHYVFAGSSLFAVMAAIYYWFPKMYGRMLDERIGKLSFWTMFVGFNAAFFPMHILGFMGMPRRIYTFQPGLGFDTLNLIESVGAFVFTLGLVISLWNVIQSRAVGEAAPPNPWGASTLEWLAASPPEHYNFERLPIVASRDPLWDGQYTFGPAYDEGRLTVRTSVLDANLEKVIEMPEDDVWAVLLALALLAIPIGILWRWYGVAIAGVIVSLAMLARWLWPSHRRVLETEI
ncbi:MAG TPA: cytochrome c oxidase subunit I [Gemmatimonadaceae bacterium]|nr:cytochrome c oxidase subunit I [Gemmatimonadaceae bacterium]